MLDKLKMLLGITDSEKDFALQYVIGAVTDMVLNYCNIEELPPQLENTVLSICMDKYRADSIGQEQAQGRVTGITEGNVSVSFGSSYSVNDNPSMAFLKNYTAQLDRFKKLGRW